MLRVENLSLRRGSNQVLSDISLVLEAGQVLGVLGPNGCLLYTSPSPRDLSTSRMPSSA